MKVHTRLPKEEWIWQTCWRSYIEAIMESYCYTQIELAEHMGVTQQSISIYMSGTRYPSKPLRKKLQLLADTADIHVEDYLISAGSMRMLRSVHRLQQTSTIPVRRLAWELKALNGRKRQKILKTLMEFIEMYEDMEKHKKKKKKNASNSEHSRYP